MDARQAYEMQAKVRHNAEIFKNTVSDLYSWQKDIKEKEKNLLQDPSIKQPNLETIPVRSHMIPTKNQKETKTPSPMTKKVKEPTEVKDSNKETTSKEDIQAEKRKRANEWKDLGNKHVKLNEYERAIHAYTEAIKAHALDPVFYNNRALCYLRLERFDECITDCESAIEIDKLSVKAYYRRMQAYEMLGNNMDALKDCTSVLMIDPKNGEAKRSLERINERLHKNSRPAHMANFSELRDNMVDILPVEKPAYKRSSKPLKRISINEIVSTKYKNDLKISDEDIDKLFNSNCGPFVEVKKKTAQEKKETAAHIVEKHASAVEKKLTEIERNVKKIDQSIKKTEKVSEQKSSSETRKNAKPENDEKSEKISSDQTTKPIKERPLPPAPKFTAQFYSQWKELSMPKKYEYLKSIDLSSLCKILGASLDSETLGDIIKVLHDYYLPNKDSSLASTVLEVSKNNEVDLLSLLMSADERKAISNILNTLKEDETESSVIHNIARNFNLDDFRV